MTLPATDNTIDGNPRRTRTVDKHGIVRWVTAPPPTPPPVPGPRTPPDAHQAPPQPPSEVPDRASAPPATTDAAKAPKPRPHRTPVTRRVIIEAFTHDEMLNGHAAYKQWQRGKRGPLNLHEMAARAAYRKAKTGGIQLRRRPRPTPAQDAILRLVGMGMTLEAIATARGTRTTDVIHALARGGHHDVIAALKAEHDRPMRQDGRSTERPRVVASDQELPRGRSPTPPTPR